MPTNSFPERIKDELREFSIVAIYFFLCFGSISYLKFAILQTQGVEFAPFGFALAKALICAKFVMVGRAIHLGEGFKKRPLLWRLLYRVSAFWVLLLVLNVAEEFIVGLIHRESVGEILIKIGGGTLHQALATSIVMLLVLTPYFAFRMLGELIGDRNLVRLFVEYHRGVDSR